MPTNQEYKRIALNMESAIYFINNPEASRNNLVYAFGKLDESINSTFHSCDPIWVWWLQFEVFSFANETKPRSEW